MTPHKSFVILVIAAALWLGLSSLDVIPIPALFTTQRASAYSTTRNPSSRGLKHTGTSASQVPTPTASIPSIPSCPGHAAIRARYEAELRLPGNVEKHMPILFALASGFANITELGVHSVHSSWALARAASDGATRGERVTYRAVDIARDGRVTELEAALLQCPGVTFSFTEADDLLIDVWESNFLFLDTWHTYKQLTRELERWPQKVTHYIALHDTVLFADRDESEAQASRRKEELFSGLPAREGLRAAVNEFLQTDEGANWHIFEHYTNQNGVMVLERKNFVMTVTK